MAGAATVTFAELADLIREMPAYEGYGAREEAASNERAWRLALGRLLKECGDRLLGVIEQQPHLITEEQHDTIDALIEGIGRVLRFLSQRGEICLRPGDRSAIAELEELDLRLLLLLEEALSLAAALACDVRASSWFAREAVRLSHGLAALGDATQERNCLLGLIWEAEPALDSRNGRTS